MNRRSFLSKIIKAAAAPMVLPAALTYARTWIFSGSLIVPDCVLTQQILDDFYVRLTQPWPHPPWNEMFGTITHPYVGPLDNRLYKNSSQNHQAGVRLIVS